MRKNSITFVITHGINGLYVSVTRWGNSPTNPLPARKHTYRPTSEKVLALLGSVLQHNPPYIQSVRFDGLTMLISFHYSPMGKGGTIHEIQTKAMKYAMKGA